MNPNLNDSSLVLIVGDGKLARHWQHYLSLKSIPYLSWSRKENLPFEQFVQANKARVAAVYLLISDTALAKFFDEYKNLFDASVSWFHASGALSLAGMIDAHPMMSFADELYDLDVYEKIPFTTTAKNIQNLNILLRGLPNKVNQIEVMDKPLYHALCVLGAAGTNVLWSALTNELSKLGISRDATQQYQDQIFKNLKEYGVKAITGPWVRRDVQTQQLNVESLSALELKNTYVSLKKVYDELAKH